MGKGAFGEVFECIDTMTQESFAVKVEGGNVKKKVLKQEVGVLRRVQASRCFPRLVASGRFRLLDGDDTQAFMVMQLLGISYSSYPFLGIINLLLIPS